MMTTRESERRLTLTDCGEPADEREFVGECGIWISPLSRGNYRVE